MSKDYEPTKEEKMFFNWGAWSGAILGFILGVLLTLIAKS
jgi:hypothetical protein